jgi:hypothetical protein
MTPPAVEPSFEREYGCTTTEWLRWLPGAVRDCALRRPVEDEAAVELNATARLELQWTVLPPRRIALMSMPRLRVVFNFSGSTAEQRQAFMRYFDLYMQRGGG